MADDERFLRDAEDLVTVIDVPAPLAALGTTVQVPTLDGDVPLEIPAGTQPGETIVMRGRGLPPLSRGRTGDLRVVVNVAIPRRLSREQRALLEELSRIDHRGQPALRRGHAGQAQAGARRVIRLAVRVPRAAAEIVLAELLELSPAGLEETDVSEGVVEYALYGAEGELPDLPALQAAAGDALVDVSTSVVPDDWADRWKAWHRPVDVAWRFRRLRVRPPWEEALADETGIDLVIDPGQAFGTGRAPHHAALARAAARARPRRRAGGLGLGQRRAGDRGGAARLRAGAGGRRRAGLAGGVGGERRAQRGLRSRCGA